MALLQSGDRLRFLYPATIEGSAYTSLLTWHFTRLGYTASTLEIPGLICQKGVPAKQELRTLVSVLSGEIRTARRQRLHPLIYDHGHCPAIAAYTALVGQVFSTPVFTQCKSSSLLPTPTLRNLQLLTCHHEDFFHWLQVESRSTAEVRPFLDKLPEAIATLIDSSHEGLTTLSPLGELFFEAHLAQQEQSRSTFFADIERKPQPA